MTKIESDLIVRIDALKTELARIDLMYESASSEDTKDDLWIVRDRMKAELGRLTALGEKEERTATSKWITRIGAVEKLAGGGCLLLLLFVWLGSPDQNTYAAAETGYRVFSKLHLMIYGAGVLVFVAAVLKAVLRRHRELRRLVKAVTRDVQDDIK